MADDSLDSEGLARKASADPDAFAELVRRLRGRLEMWINVRMGPLLDARLTADDVLQETLLQAHGSLHDFKEQGKGSFQRWLFSVAENRLKDLHKYHAAQKRHPGHEAAGDFDLVRAPDPTPSSSARRRELVHRLATKIAALPDHLREILVLRALEERTFKEIAEITKKPAATVQGLFARALKVLQHELA
jgi:RNA polymerase sigma-70 factor (ECF subfamily)